MATELALGGVAGLGAGDAVNMLSQLLSITSDAVLMFDAQGTITLANEEAERVFRATVAGLATTNVRELFVPAATVDELKGPLEDSLPFLLDGSSCELVCEGRDHTHVRLRVRCERLGSVAGTYLLCAHALAGQDQGAQDDRLLEELSRANKRLSGTLSIVLGTLDSLDVGTLFNRILDEICQTMDAWATLAYVAERNGYRLCGSTDSLGDAHVPVFVANDDPLAQFAYAGVSSTRMHVRALSRDELRQGQAHERTVVCEETGATMAIPAVSLPPFACFVTVPVWFGGRMIALLIVGWKHVQRLRKDDVTLLDAVAEYLSVQLAGAFAAMRAQHGERLESLASELRERMLASATIDSQLMDEVFESVAEGIDSTCVLVVGNVHQRTNMVALKCDEPCVAPSGVFDQFRDQALPCVADVANVCDLTDWLERKGAPSQGLFVALGLQDGSERGYLLLREADEEPLEEMDVAFVRRVATDVLEIREGERVRKQDTHIAQALQQGMANELQKVEGISAQSVYSSATETAYVGGDFYDLIRLPKRQACVIMGDVSGKGVEAASVSAAVKVALGAYAWEGLTPARMVSLLNEFLLGFSRLETFATLFVGMVDLAAGTLTYCSAGHPPAMLVRASSGELAGLEVQSGVVGAFGGMRYLDGEVCVRQGDILLLYTDGVTEARKSAGDFFGEEGLRDVLVAQSAGSYDGLCERILSAVESFAGNTLEDDVALVALRFDEVGNEQPSR